MKLILSLKAHLVAFVGFLSILTMLTNASAQTIDVQIGTQTGTTTFLPLNAYYGYSYSQQIYTASDLMGAGITGPATISKIRFYRVDGSLSNSFQWTVYLANSTKTAFTSNSDWELSSNLNEVFNGNIVDAGSNAWMEITLSTPFAWDGTSNLIVAVDENQSSYGGTSNWRKSDLGSNRAIYYTNDYTNPSPASPPSGTRLGSVNNLQLVAASNTDCTGAPASTSIISSTGADACENELFNLSLENGNTLYFYEGITYQWQSFDGTDWNDIANATNSTLNETANLNTSAYQVVIGCAATGDQTIVSPISINVNAAPPVSVDIDSTVVCPATSIAITASGANTYSWSPETGLSAASTASVNAFPTSTTVYTVTGTDAVGCTATAQSKIYTYGAIATEISTTPTNICEPNVPVAIEITTPPSVMGGNWEYRFLNADGTTVAQAWNTTNTYNFIPTTDSVYTFYVQLRNSACGTALDSVSTSVVVGFGGDISKVDYDCNNLGGTINVLNAFGQVESTMIYNNALASASDATGIAMTGATTITDGRLVLTPSATSSSGAASFNTTGDLGSNNSMNLSFLMTMDTPINVGADGLAYSFGNDVLTTAGSLQNGRGTKLRLSFDAIDNSGSNGNIRGAYLVYGWTSTIEFGPTSAGVLAFNSNVTSWFNKTDVLVNLIIDATGKATVTVDGQVLFSDVQLPEAYMNADASSWKHHFGAQTGGYAFRHAVSDVKISTGSVSYGISQGTSTTLPTEWQTNGTFTDLAPGIYHVWLAQDSTATCRKNIETIEVLNTNPVINLGADTTICNGQTLLLDAENSGATYVWSGTNSVTQTLEVSNAGTYTVYATMPNGCFGVGNINVSVNDVPSAAGIFRQGTYPNFTFTVLNATNSDSYSWNFGDGTTLTNAPSTISHYYTSDASVTVTATLTNDCGSITISQNYADLSVKSNELVGLELYPNPASDQFTISLNGAIDASVTVVSTTGTVVFQQTTFSEKLIVNTDQWESGIYFVTVSNNGIASTQKLSVK